MKQVAPGLKWLWPSLQNHWWLARLLREVCPGPVFGQVGGCICSGSSCCRYPPALTQVLEFLDNSPLSPDAAHSSQPLVSRRLITNNTELQSFAGLQPLCFTCSCWTISVAVGLHHFSSGRVFSSSGVKDLRSSGNSVRKCWVGPVLRMFDITLKLWIEVDRFPRVGTTRVCTVYHQLAFYFKLF